jgi:hypothetical protein
MADQPKKIGVGGVGSYVWGMLEMLFFGLALVSFAAAAGTILYEVWGLVTGQGWHHYRVGNALDWLLGMPPLAEDMTTWHQILAVSSILPLDITLMALAWVFSKISNGLEKLT